MCQRAQKFAQAGGQVGIVEVQHQADTHQASHAAGHVGVAAEVEVDLPGEGERGQQERRSIVEIRRGVDRIDVQPQVVGQRHLLEQTDDEQRQAVADVGRANHGKSIELRQQLAGPLDRPGDQLRKQRHEGGEANEAAFAIDLATIEVDRVAHRLERVERNAHRQQDVRSGQLVAGPQLCQQPVDVVGDESAVLEEAEQQQVVDHAQAQPRSCGTGCGPSGPPSSSRASSSRRSAAGRAGSTSRRRSRTPTSSQCSQNRVLRSSRKTV